MAWATAPAVLLTTLVTAQLECRGAPTPDPETPRARASKAQSGPDVGQPATSNEGEGGGAAAADATGAKGGAGGADDSSGSPRGRDPAGAATDDPRFRPSRSVESLSEFLVDPAKQAMRDRQFARAVSLYQGLVAARGFGDRSATELGKAWVLANQPGLAVGVYQDFAAATDDDDARVRALAEADRLRNVPIPFQRRFKADWATKEAVSAFKLGRKEFKRKHYADALVYYRIAAAVDPTLNGPIREIGATYGKLGAAPERERFYLDYLWRSPVGPFSDEVRKQLGKTNKLGLLTVASKLPCDEVWVEGQRVRDKLPIKKLALAQGYYRWLCYNEKYAIEYFDEVKVEAGKSTELEFHWAVLINDLQEPWGRILIENPREPGVMKDLGVEIKEIGILVPADGRALRLILKDPRGQVVEERFVRIAAGAREVIRWKKK